MMGEVIFCKTRHQDIGYQSYSDFWAMVQWAGYPIIYVDQLDPQSDNTYIITPLNGEWIDGWKSPKAKIIHWEFEWRTDWRAKVDEPEGVAEVWAMDRWYAAQIGARYVPVGGDDRLNQSPVYVSRPQNSIALLNYQTPRRQIITSQLQSLGINITAVSGHWGVDRSIRLSNASAMVHVHQLDNMNTVAGLRWCIAAAHGLAMITETVHDRGIFDYSYMMQSDYVYLASFTKHCLADPRMLADYGRALHQLLCVDYTFRRSVDAHV